MGRVCAVLRVLGDRASHAENVETSVVSRARQPRRSVEDLAMQSLGECVFVFHRSYGVFAPCCAC